MRSMHTWPIRKPLALFAAGLVAFVVLWSVVRGQDIPTNVKDLVQWFASLTIAAYYASSTTEAVKEMKARCDPAESGSVQELPPSS